MSRDESIRGCEIMKNAKKRLTIFIAVIMSFIVLSQAFCVPVYAIRNQNVEDTDTVTTEQYDPNQDSTFVLANSDVKISDDYLSEDSYVSEIENPELTSITDSSDYELEIETRNYPEGLVLSETQGDPMVYLTQKWLNQEYGDVPGFGSVPENGKTGWDTIYGLTRALQHELGITDLANNFGPTTERLYGQNPLRRQDGVTNRQFAILQGALWCKGYSPGYYLRENPDGTVSFDEIFNESVERAVIQLKEDAGLINPDGVVTVNVMKALMSMDAFKLLSSYGGDTKVRAMQQKLNRKYEAYTGLTPCDGVYGRNTNKAIVYALQAEEGLPTSVANGNFGNTTKKCCPQIPYARNSSAAKNYYGSYYSSSTISAMTELVQFALYVNGFGDGVTDGVFDDGTRQAIRSFQKQYAIPITGKADRTTWLSLFISCGDTDRSALAADCATILTAAKAKSLYDNGYRYIGRYLTGTYNGGISKAITRAEAQIIFDAGLRFFPIYQTSARKNSYFTPKQGIIDANAAIDAANKLGIPNDTIIYFAVDFDCMDYEITSNIIPYFKSVSEAMEESSYRVGIYGTRNACSRVSKLGYACSSFVGDMSTGFSGNLGFSMPENWAFDQFKTTTIGSGAGTLEIDKDGYSGHDPAVSELKPVEDFNININVGSNASDTLYGPTVSFLRNDMPLFELNVGFDLDDFLQFESIYDSEEDEYKVLIGVNIGDTESETSGAKTKVGKFNQAYREVKTTISCMGNKKEFTRRLDDFKGSLYQRGVKVGFDGEGYFFGYLTVDAISGNTKESGVALVVSLGADTRYPIPFFPCCYLKFAIEGSIESGFKLVYDQSGQSNQADLAGDLEFNVTPKMSVGFDVLVANAYAGMDGTLDCKLKLPCNSFKKCFEASLSAAVFFEYQALYWGDTFEWTFAKTKLYPRGPAVQTLSITKDDLKFIEPLPQTYNRDATNSNDVIASNMQVYCNPKIVSLGNGKMLMTYIVDVADRTAVNRSVLMYSVYNGSNWSIPKPVLDDYTADFEPAIYADGNGGAHILWQNCSSVFSSNVTIDEMSKQTELYYTHWNGLSFDGTTAITNNSDYEMAHRIVASGNNITVVWQQNSENDVFALSGTNSVYRRQYTNGSWQNIEAVSTELSTITSLDTAYVGNNNVIAYSAKTNMDNSTLNDMELFYFNGSDIIQVTNDTVPDYSVSLLDDKLYWISDNSIVSVTNGDIATKSIILSDNSSNISKLKALQNEEGKTSIVWKQEINSISNFYCVDHNKITDSFDSPKPISTDNGIIRSWDACIMPNGQIEMAYCFAEKLDGSTTEKPYGRLDLMQKTADDFCDIYVDSIANYDGEVGAEQTIKFHTQIYNNGSTNVNQFTVNVLDENRTLLQSSNIDCDLPVGTQAELEIPFMLPTNITKTDYTIQIYPNDQSDTDLSNNESVVTIGDADVIISNIQESRTATNRIISVTVKNNGFSAVDSASLKFFKDGAEGALLETKSVDTLLPSVERTYHFSISNDELSSDISEGPRSYYLLLETDTVETNIGNNSQTIYVYPDFSISLASSVGGTVTGSGLYAKGETATLIAIPNSGYIFDGWYENGQRLYGISEEYTVTVSENRTLEARFKMNDLQILGLETFGSEAVGEVITFTATAIGGIQPWQWEFYIKKNDTIVYSDSMATVDFFEWTPQESGEYNVLVYVTDATGKKVSHSISVTIT